MMSWILSSPTPPSVIYLEPGTYFLLFIVSFNIFQLAISFRQLLYNFRVLERCFKVVFHHFTDLYGITNC